MRLGKPKLLMVEDEKNNHLLYRTAFEGAGFDVAIFSYPDGDFIDAVVGYGPDLISMDVMIGNDERVIERDGFDALMLLKADERTKDVPVIFLTNFFSDEKVERAKTIGAVDYIVVQGHDIAKTAERYRKLVDHPKKYTPVNDAFRN